MKLSNRSIDSHPIQSGEGMINQLSQLLRAFYNEIVQIFNQIFHIQCYGQISQSIDKKTINLDIHLTLLLLQYLPLNEKYLKSLLINEKYLKSSPNCTVFTFLFINFVQFFISHWIHLPLSLTFSFTLGSSYLPLSLIF